MKIYLQDYIKEIDELLNSKEKITDDIIKKHIIKIGFFQHERLIHLLVTLFYGLLAIIFMTVAFAYYYLLFIVTFILLIFLMFYVVHYFRLENGVQYLYKQYDKMLKKNKK